MKKSVYKYLSVALCIMMIFVQFVPVYGASSPIGASPRGFTADPVMIQEAASASTDAVDLQHFWDYRWP